MEENLGFHSPRTVEDVYNDFKGRRTGMVRALTTDFEQFYQLCDPEKENLCLYGFPNESWKVSLPADEVPAELPEPALGINFARDGMQERDWLSLVSVHSDAWLLSVAFYFGARCGFDKDDRGWYPAKMQQTWIPAKTVSTLQLRCRIERGHLLDYLLPSPTGKFQPSRPLPCDHLLKVATSASHVSGKPHLKGYEACFDSSEKRLFQMMNDVPTIFEAVTGNVNKQSLEKSTSTPINSNKSKPSGKMQPQLPESQTKRLKTSPPLKDKDESGDEDDDEQGASLCGACGDSYASGEFWICCDVCERWFHGKCVKITPARAEHIKQYKCPACSNKRARA